MTPHLRRSLRRLFRSTKPDHLQLNFELARKIPRFAEDGQIAVIESGMDCDGVRYWGDVTLIPATLTHFEAHWRKRAQWSDGPFDLEIAKPSEALRVESGSRDLALEAFEDGHPHCLFD